MAAAAFVAAVVLVLTAASGPAMAAFPGANGKIAFMSNRDGDSEIYTMNPSGSHQTKLTKNEIADGFAVWSPGGHKIAFVRQPSEIIGASYTSSGRARSTR